MAKMVKTTFLADVTPSVVRQMIREGATGNEGLQGSGETRQLAEIPGQLA